MNLNHDQRVVIGHQQLVQNNKVLIQTHDPAYAKMVEQTAEAQHRLAIAETEAQANFRHEAISENLKEALKVHEAQEVNHARVAVREREANTKSEAVQHLRAHEAQCKVKVEAYQRILDANPRQPPRIVNWHSLELRRLKGACTGGAHQEARRAGDATKSPKSEAPKFVGLSTVAATSRPSCRNGNFDENGGSILHFCVFTYVSRRINCIGARCSYDSPTICAAPYACRS